MLRIRKVSRAHLSEQVIEQLQDLILQGHLSSGDRLPSERELCEQFGVSRTVVREAMKVLAQRGMLMIEPGRGTFVTLPAEHDLARSITLFAQAHDVSFTELVAVRRALEPEIADLAAGGATEAHLRRLQSAVEVMDRSLTDPEAYVAADQEFHGVLAEATGNNLFIALAGVFVDLEQDARKLMFRVPEAPKRGQRYHREILACVAAGDGEGARATMLEHLRDVERGLREATASSRDKGE